MSKLSTGHYEVADSSDEALSSSRNSFAEDAQVEYSVSRTTTDDAVQHFAQTYGLTDHIDALTKASALLQHGMQSNELPVLSNEEASALRYEDEKRWYQPKMLYFTIIVCSVGAIEQGWAQTSMNGANLYFPKAFGIDSDSRRNEFIVGLINSCIYLSTGLIGAWCSDPINNMIGRRGAVAVGSVLCLVGNCFSALSQTWPQLLIFRFVLGLGLGIDASTVSVYAAECAPANIRGGLAVCWQMFIAFGIFLGFVANVAAFRTGASAWRIQLGAAAIPTIPLGLMVYFCPESPSWYIKNEKYRLAFRSLCRLRNTELQAARDVYSVYLQRNVNSKSADIARTPFMQKILELFIVPRIRRATTASYVLMLSQQLCGINIIAFYSSTIFLESGFSRFGALLASCVFGFINFIGAFPAIWTMDTLGRRSLLLLTLPFMALTMFAAGLSFYIPNDNTAHLVVLASLIYLFCAAYSPGMGPVPPAYSAEAFPLSHREVGMSMGVATANIWAACLSLTFPWLLSTLGARGSFELYAGLNLVALVLIFLFVPETRLKTLDELDDVFSVPTISFIRYQTTEWLPWVTKRYLLRQNEIELRRPPTDERGQYRELQLETDD